MSSPHSGAWEATIPEHEKPVRRRSFRSMGTQCGRSVELGHPRGAYFGDRDRSFRLIATGNRLSKTPGVAVTDRPKGCTDDRRNGARSGSA